MPKDLKEFLFLIQEQLILHFENKIFGIYVYGSISYGDFKEHRSDVDVMVFLRSRLTHDEISKLKQIYSIPLIKNSKWAKKLEMDYIFIEDVDPIKNTVETICFRGEKIVEATVEGLSIDLKNLIDCGIVLYGEEPKKFISEIKDDLLGEALWEKFVHLKENAPKWSKLNFWNQMYIVVQLCRVIYSLENNNESVSKKEAARWCSQNLPEKYQAMIKIALEGIEEWEKPIDKEIESKLKDFIAYVEDLLHVKLKVLK